MAYRNSSHLMVAAPQGTTFSRYLIEAVKDLWRRPGHTVFAVLITALAAAPLYALDYHVGAIALPGLAIATMAGAAVTGFVIRRHCLATGRSLFHEDWAGAIVGTMLVTLVVMAALYGGMQLAPVIYPDLAEPVAAITRNTQAYAWKPFAHIALGATLLYAVVPSMLLAVPLRMQNSLSLREGFWVVGRQVEDRHYSWRPAVVMLTLIATTLVWVPYVCVLVPAVMSNLSMRLYRDVFSTQKK